MTEERNRELAKSWLKAAKHDLDWAEGSMGLKEFSGVCFLAQQIVEKSLKAFLFKNKLELKKIHDLDALLVKAIRIDDKFSIYKETTATLNNYYLETRYPDIGDVEQFNKKELAEEAINWAKEIFSYIENKIS